MEYVEGGGLCLPQDIFGGSFAATGMTVVPANAQGNIDLISFARVAGAEFSAPAENFTKNDQYASTKVAADFFNFSAAYHAGNPNADRLVVTGANKNDGSLFQPHQNSHTTQKPAIDVRYQTAEGKNLRGHSASSLAGVDRTRDFLALAGRFGFTRTVTNIEGIGSFQVFANHDDHIHLGE